MGVESTCGQLFFNFTEPGHQSEQSFERAEILNHLHLVEEVGEIEFTLLHPLHGAHRVGFVDLIGDLLDHSDDVTHPENPVSHAVRVKFEELV